MGFLMPSVYPGPQLKNAVGTHELGENILNSRIAILPKSDVIDTLFDEKLM